MSDYYDDDTINNVTNIYNNYDYDDSTLIGKLEGWFGEIKSKLDTIIDNTKTTVGNGFDFLVPESVSLSDEFGKFSADWGELLKTKLPVIDKVIALLTVLQSQNDPLVISCQNPMYFLAGDSANTDYEPFTIDFSWYDTTIYKGKSARIYVREGIGYVFMACCCSYLYKNLSKIFDED